MKKILFVLLTIILFVSCNNKEKNDVQKITIVLDWTPNTNHTGLFVAKEKGYFDEIGIDVEIVQPPEGSTTQLISTGKAEFGISFQDTLAKYFSKVGDNIPITVVAAILQHNTSGLVSLKEKNINSFKDLEGKTYATWDDPIEQAILTKLMKDEGADFSKVNIIPYSWDVIKALKTDTDAAWIYYAWDGIALKNNNIEFNFLEAKVSPELDYYTPVIIANNDFLKNHKELSKKIMKAIKKGYEFSVNNPEEAATILLNADPTLDKDLVINSQKWISTKYIDDAKYWGYIDKDRWNKFYDFLYENKLIENKIEKDYGFTNEFIEE